MINCWSCGAENFEDFSRLTATRAGKLRDVAEKYCKERGLAADPINIIIALSDLGCIGKKQALRYTEV